MRHSGNTLPVKNFKAINLNRALQKHPGFGGIKRKNLAMQVMIKYLKKGDQFKFNYTIYTVKQKFADWKKNDEPYLVTECGTVFEFDELEVEKL